MLRAPLIRPQHNISGMSQVVDLATIIRVTTHYQLPKAIKQAIRAGDRAWLADLLEILRKESLANPPGYPPEHNI